MIQYNRKEILAYSNWFVLSIFPSFIGMHDICNSSRDANCQELQAVHAILQQIIRKSRNEIAYSTFQYIYLSLMILRSLSNLNVA